LKGPHYINIILGNIYNAQSDISSISSIVNNLPKNSMTCLGGIGKEQLKCNTIGLLYFNGLRVGLEDNLYYRDKEKTTNIDLLKRIHRIMGELDVNLMTPSEFRHLGYANKKINNIGKK
jgi:uncharacterized protein (DUF849 family)